MVNATSAVSPLRRRMIDDMTLRNPRLKLYELYDLIHKEAGLYVSESVEGETVANLRKLDLNYNYVLRTIKQRKSNLVRRHVRIAEQYIFAVREGQFPLRNTR